MARGAPVRPIYVARRVSPGKAEERAMAARLFAAPPFDGRIDPLVTLSFDMRDVFPSIALGGEGRAAGVRHARRGRLPSRPQRHPRVESGGLSCRGEDSSACCSARSRAIRFPTQRPRVLRRRCRARCRWDSANRSTIDAPFSTPCTSRTSYGVGVALGVPLELTLSCMQPKDGLHCGQCSKCRERRDAFAEAGVADPTTYRQVPIR